MSRLDHFYRSILLTKFFVKGWGNPEKLKRILEFRKIISNRESCQHLVSPDYPVHIEKEDVQKECTILEGYLKSPIIQHLPDIMPKESENARFQVILPNKWNYKYPHLKPVCLQLAGTGDHYYWRRRTLCARPLLKKSGIASIILENPYYGVRKPKQQLRSSLHNVSDLFVMGGALVLESLALFHWCERQGYGPLGITGISMGGFMASAAATNWHKPLSVVPCLSWTTGSTTFTEMASLAGSNWHRPLSVVPCLSWSTASAVFCQGVMSGAIPWQLLEDQYTSDKMYDEEVSKLIHSPEKNSRYYTARQMGQEFVRNFPESLDRLTDIQNQETSRNKINDSNLNTDSVTDVNNIELSEEQVKHNSVLPTQSPSQPGGVISNKTALYHTMSSKSPNQTDLPNNNENSKAKRFAEMLRFTKLLSKKPKDSKSQEGMALEFMKGVMDECTHLGNFSVPIDPELIIIIAAKMDAYVPRDCVLSLEEIWPGSEVRYIDSGHISAFLFKQDVFRDAIADSFDRLTEKYYKDGYPGKY